MKILCISDTHTNHWKLGLLPQADILLHAGDFTNLGELHLITDFNHWLSEQPIRHKIVIAGNHDRLFQLSHYQAKSLLTHATYLQDEWVEVEGLRIYGSPWQPAFNNWAFNLPRGQQLQEKWALIPNDIDILLTHTPPMFDVRLDNALLDYIPQSNLHAGCSDLTTRVQEIKPKLHVFGHIHAGYGTYLQGKTTYVNAAVADERNTVSGDKLPIMIEL